MAKPQVSPGVRRWAQPGYPNTLLMCTRALATWTPEEGNKTEIRENHDYPSSPRGQHIGRGSYQVLFRGKPEGHGLLNQMQLRIRLHQGPERSARREGPQLPQSQESGLDSLGPNPPAGTPAHIEK